MEEINGLKRLLNLSEEERKELDENQEIFTEVARKLIQSYEKFEIEKVKAGRLKTLLDNVIYKINFSYGELFRTSSEIRNELAPPQQGKQRMSAGLLKEIEEFLAENSSRKEY